jgi:hypothetical protein
MKAVPMMTVLETGIRQIFPWPHTCVAQNIRLEAVICSN